jgi:hypothetical protein
MTLKLSLERDTDEYLLVAEIRLYFKSMGEGLVNLQKIGDIFSPRTPVTKPPVVLEQEKIKALAPKSKNKNQSRAGVPGWTQEEIDLLNACPDHIEAWVAYQKVFTDRRNKNAVHQRWNKLHRGKKSSTKTTINPTILVVAPPEESARDKINKLVVIKNGTISVGTKVKYNGPHSSPFANKTGEVTKIGTKDQVLVKFGDSSSWLSQHIISVIPEVAA